MAHEVREFGVPANDINLPYEPPGYEQTAELPAGSNYIYERQHLQDEQRANRDAAIAEEIAEQRSIQTAWKRDYTFGPFTKPNQETLRGYKFKLRENNGANEIQFSRQKFPIFDNVIVHECGTDSQGKSLHPAFNPDHPRYQEFAPLRRNIAILRNYLLVTMFPEGDFKPKENSPAGREDAENRIKIQQMAMKLGKALKGGYAQPTLVERFFHSLGNLITGKSLDTPEVSAFLQSANIPDKGAATMYDYLFDLQNKPGFWDSLPFVQSSRNWNLPPRDQSPFSNSNLLTYGNASMLEGVAEKFDRVTTKLNSVDKLSTEDKKVSVDHARTILEKLRILLGNAHQETELSEIADPKLTESFMLLRAAEAFKSSLAEMAAVDPHLLHDRDIQAAIEAVEQINYRVKTEAQIALEEEGESDAAKVMASRRARTPEKSKTKAPLRDLVAALETGISKSAVLRKSPSITSAIQQSRAPDTSTQLLVQQTQQDAVRRAKKAAAKAAEKAKTSVAPAKPTMSAPTPVSAAAKAAEKATMTMSNARITQAPPQVVSAVNKLNEEKAQRQMLDNVNAPTLTTRKL